jgi:hypothetical protein
MLQHVTLLFLHKIFVSYSLLGMFFLADVNLGSDISSYYGVIQMCVSPLLYREKSGLCVCVSVCVGCVCVCVCVLWVNSKGKYKMETIYELGVCAQNR